MAIFDIVGILIFAAFAGFFGWLVFRYAGNTSENESQENDSYGLEDETIYDPMTGKTLTLEEAEQGFAVDKEDLFPILSEEDIARNIPEPQEQAFERARRHTLQLNLKKLEKESELVHSFLKFSILVELGYSPDEWAENSSLFQEIFGHMDIDRRTEEAGYPHFQNIFSHPSGLKIIFARVFGTPTILAHKHLKLQTVDATILQKRTEDLVANMFKRDLNLKGHMKQLFLSFEVRSTQPEQLRVDKDLLGLLLRMNNPVAEIKEGEILVFDWYPADSSSLELLLDGFQEI